MSAHRTPDEILEGWEELVRTQAHIHAPEVASRLGIAEAALVASRIGTGATRLSPDIRGILAPIDQCGRVLCAFSNECGVHMPLGLVRTTVSNGRLFLTGDHMAAHVDMDAVKDAYLFVDQDESHGNTRSIQFFDAYGAPIVKIFIFHKAKFAAYQPYLDTFASPNQSREVSVSAEKSRGSSGDGEGHRHSKPSGPEVAVCPKETFPELLNEGGQFEIGMISRHAVCRWHGQLSGIRTDDNMLHLHEADIRSHLRFAAMEAAEQSPEGDLNIYGSHGLIMTAQKVI